MSYIDYKCDNGVLTIFLHGRVDSTNAPDVEAEADAALAGAEHTSVIIDADDLLYISSAGLRFVLRLRKNEPTLEVINASSEIFDILEMTGFTEMIPVRKAYRKISIDGCEVIGQGANGKVYRIDGDTIVKVYYSSDALPDIHRERELARCAFVMGIPTAIPYDVVKVGSSYGSVFELLNAKSFASLTEEHPEKLDEYIKLSVELMKKIHATEVKPDDMPDMRDVAINWVTFLKDHLPADTASKLVSLMEAVPVDNHMLHGDFHFKNIMLQEGEVLLIDLDTLCHGHPIFELAGMYNAYVGFSALDPTVSESFLGIPQQSCKRIWRQTVALYLGTDDEQQIAAVEEKAMLIGYARLLRRTIRRPNEKEMRDERIAFYKEKVTELTAKLDTLTF